MLITSSSPVGATFEATKIPCAVGRCAPSQGTERIVNVSSPTRFVRNVDDPPPSQLAAHLHPSASIASPSSYELNPTELFAPRPSFIQRTRVPSSLTPTIERAASSFPRFSVVLTSAPSLTTIPKDTPTAWRSVPSARYLSTSALLNAFTSQLMFPSASWNTYRIDDV